MEARKCALRGQKHNPVEEEKMGLGLKNPESRPNSSFRKMALLINRGDTAMRILRLGATSPRKSAILYPTTDIESACRWRLYLEMLVSVFLGTMPHPRGHRDGRRARWTWDGREQARRMDRMRQRSATAFDE